MTARSHRENTAKFNSEKLIKSETLTYGNAIMYDSFGLYTVPENKLSTLKRIPGCVFFIQ